MAKYKTVKVRILTDAEFDGMQLKADSVVVLDAKDAKSLVATGWADDNVAAVAYAESLAA